MKVIAFNGSPRQNGTTATLLDKALEGAASQGAKTEFIHLSRLKMKGCQGCYSCKKRGGKSYGKCALRDGMTLLYPKMEDADAVFIGSPMYFGTVTSATKMFIERLYPYSSYKDFQSTFPKKIPVGLIFTMGVDDREMEALSYRHHLELNQMIFLVMLGPTEVLVSTDTLHVEDYSEIVADGLEPQIGRKLEHQRRVFPLDCEKAFEMGARFAGHTST